MLSFQIDTELTKQLVALNDQISEKYALLQGLTKDQRESIHKYAWISSVGASTRIENAILTDSEIGWLDSILGKDGKASAFDAHREAVLNKLSKDKERSLEEVAGCRRVLLLIYEQAQSYLPLSESTLKGLHRELFRHYSKPGVKKGDYKTSPNSVIEYNHQTKEQKTIFKTADPGVQTSTAMHDLLDWYNQAIHHEPWPVAVAAELTYRFLAIHPFQDGNGRLGRALFLMSLLHAPGAKLSDVVFHMAVDRHIERHKEEYYIVLNQCSGGQFKTDPTEYRIQYFLKYMIKVLEGSLADVDFYIDRVHAYQKLSESALKVLNCFKDLPEIRIKPKTIREATGLPTRTVANVLDTLRKAEFIQRSGQGPATCYQLVF
ncbi:MAG: Fic family protein [Bdellovibrionaceae bacterium]|nr:Fic family protein [Pseudobdellovibrionaceae bacterium]